MTLAEYLTQRLGQADAEALTTQQRLDLVRQLTPNPFPTPPPKLALVRTKA